MSSRPAESLPLVFSEAWTRMAPRGLQAGVLLAVSGGLDSMVLANLVHTAGIRCAVAHVNFLLRGDESVGDEHFVQRWANARALPFYVTHFDTQAEAAARGQGIQEMARGLRYAWFERVRAENNYSAILTAHHADDNAETFLLNLFRGAGLTGLGGIPPVSGYLRRPLLLVRKSALQAYAEEAGVAHREDASNASDAYRRNLLRHNLFPVLEEIFPDATAKLSDTVVHLREAGSLYKTALKRRLHTLVQARGTDVYVPIRALRKAEPLVTLAHEIFSPAGFSTAQLSQILGLMDAETGRYVSSTTHRIIRYRDHLVLTKLAIGETALLTIEGFPAIADTATHRYAFREEAPPKNFAADANVAWLDSSALQGPLVLRQTRAGDYFYPLGMARKKKKVARLLTALKVPRHEKEAAWVLESGGRIAWVAGYRIDDRFKITDRTTTALRVERTPTSEQV